MKEDSEMTDEKESWSIDARTGEPIYSREDAVGIMESDFRIETKFFTQPNGVRVQKKVKFKKSLGWILKTNLKEGDLTREAYLEGLVENKKPMYEETE